MNRIIATVSAVLTLGVFPTVSLANEADFYRGNPERMLSYFREVNQAPVHESTP